MSKPGLYSQNRIYRNVITHYRCFQFLYSGHSSFRDEYYIPHTASDFYGEKGLG